MKNSTKRFLTVLMAVISIMAIMCCVAYAAQDDGAHEHVFTNYVYNNNATCTANGTMTAYCDICNIATDTKDDPSHTAPGHSEVVIPAVAATCSATGLTEGKCCSVCKTVTVEQKVVPMTAHSFSVDRFTVVAPTCYSTGAAARRCTVCKTFDIDNQEIVPMLPHNMAWTVTQEETCAADGYKNGKCTNAGCTYTETHTIIPALDHTYGDWYVTVTPTCKNEGEKVRECKNCNARKSEVLAKTEHTMVGTVPAVAPTCTQRGSVERKFCRLCNSYVDGLGVTEIYIEPLGHDLYDVCDVREATCFRVGSGHILCTRCDYSEYKEYPKTPHVDENGDGLCDIDGEDMKTNDCNCFCHTGSFFGKLVRRINTILSKLLHKEFACCDCMEPLDSLFGD